MTSRIVATLTALKAVMATVVTSIPTSPTAVYAFPQDYTAMPKPIETANLPVVVVHRLGGRRRAFGSKAVGLDRHRWLAGVDVLLLPGPLVNEEQYYQAESLFEPWLEAVKSTLFQNLKMQNTVAMIGDGLPSGELFEYIDANMMWVGRVYWGIRFELPVLHVAAQTMKGQP